MTRARLPRRVLRSEFSGVWELQPLDVLETGSPELKRLERCRNGKIGRRHEKLLGSQGGEESWSLGSPALPAPAGVLGGPQMEAPFLATDS